MSANTLIKRVIYNLKRRFGESLSVVRPGSRTPNLSTGVITSGEDTSISVGKAIILPGKAERKFSYDLSFIAANKNFTYGGFYDVDQREIIIDAKDLGAFVPKISDHILWRTKKHEVKQVSEFGNDAAYLIVVVEHKGQ